MESEEGEALRAASALMDESRQEEVKIFNTEFAE